MQLKILALQRYPGCGQGWHRVLRTPEGTGGNPTLNCPVHGWPPIFNKVLNLIFKVKLMRVRISKQGKKMEAARQFNVGVQISTNIQCAVLFNHLVGYFVPL